MTSTCPSCGKPIRPGARFCGNCGAVITPAPPVQPQAAPSIQNGSTVACPFCGKPVRPDAKFCPSCGKTIPLAAALTPTPSPQPAASSQQPPSPGVQAPASSPQPPVARKPRSILRRYGPIFLILIILGCSAMFAVGYLLGKDVFGLFGASTSTPTGKTPTRTATLSETASPMPATPTPTSTVNVMPVLPATTEPPSTTTLTPAATNTQKTPSSPTKLPIKTPTKEIGIPPAPTISIPTPIQTIVVQENFDQSLSTAGGHWGPAPAQVSKDMLVFNSVESGDTGVS